MVNDKKLSLPKAVVIVVLAGMVLLTTGIQVGKAFFWDQYQTIDPVQKDIQLLQHAAELPKNQKNDGLLVQLGWAYYQKGAYGEAVKILNQAVYANKQNPTAHFNLGIAYYELKQLDRAEAEYRRTLELDPQSKYGYYALGKLYFDQGQYDEAINQFRLATKYNLVAADNYYWLGQAYEKKGNKAEAKSAYQKVLSMVPDNAQAKEAYYRLK